MPNNTTQLDSNASIEGITVLPGVMTDYSGIIRRIHIPFISTEYYWQIREISGIQGWILHLSVIRSQIFDLLELIVPVLLAENISFKIVKDRYTAQLLLDGHLGNIHIGKIVSIYPENDKIAADLAEKLILLTQQFKGPDIPTDRWLGAIVYTRYGSFNPILVKSSNGQPVKHIYDTQGRLVADAYSIPFALPFGVGWPFHKITSPVPPKSGALLNNTYYPIDVLKNDVKGNVIKALYFKRLWRIQPCLIKQGCKCMFSDNAGRDIKDRLKWQYDLYTELSADVPVPGIFNFFYENQHAYLVMEYIKGTSVTKWIDNIFNGKSWHDLAFTLRMQLVEQLLSILHIIQRLHNRGYIHRDITPDNFMINKKGKIVLIDMELTWSANTGTPFPPFQLGTPGFASPEQLRTETPTVKEDIYALGALMLTFFTNLPPLKFPVDAPEQLHESLLFFIGDEEIAELIGLCLEGDATKRPVLDTLLEIISKFHNGIKIEEQTLYSPITKEHCNEKLQKTIKKSLLGLAGPTLLSPKHRWLSKIKRKEHHIGNVQLELALYVGWHTGMSGPLWLIANAKKAGFDIQGCQTAYNKSWEYIQNTYFSDASSSSPSLYYGGAGIALALSEGLSSDLLAPDKKNLEYLESCYSQTATQLTLSEGVAGQGLSLLRSALWLDKTKSKQILQNYIDILLIRQQPNGSWNLFQEPGKKEIDLLDFNVGVPGIIWFLILYFVQTPDSKVERAIIFSLKWMTKRVKSQKRFGLSNLGVALLYVKAFEVFKKEIYREIAGSLLCKIPSRPVTTDFSLDYGLAALGELYLEANKIFNNLVWQERSDWIAQLFIHSFQNNQNLWAVNNDTVITADLFRGNAGIIHYLIRYMFPERVGHPLSLSSVDTINLTPEI